RRLGRLPAQRGRTHRSVQAGRALVRANGAAQAEAGSAVRGGTRRHGKGWGWFFSAPDPASGKRRFYSRNGFPTKKAAQEALSAELARFPNGPFVEPPKLTGEAFLVEQWLPAVEGRRRPSTRANYRTNLQVHIIPALGALKLQ